MFNQFLSARSDLLSEKLKIICLILVGLLDVKPGPFPEVKKKSALTSNSENIIAYREEPEQSNVLTNECSSFKKISWVVWGYSPRKILQFIPSL